MLSPEATARSGDDRYLAVIPEISHGADGSPGPPGRANRKGRLALSPRAWSNCRIDPDSSPPQQRRLFAFAPLALLFAALMSLLPWSGAFAPAGASAAGPSGACGPAAQPCTWNFSPDAGSTHGADVYAGQAAGRQGAGVLVAVVDTWVDPNHPDFTGRVVDEADCVGGSCKDHSYVPDSCTHGTHVAGTVASASYGVAPEADILAVQVLNDGGTPGGQCSGTTTDVANGIEFAVAHHARVINLSVGELIPAAFQDAAVTAAVHAAAQAGAVVVIAAGNTSSPGVTDNYGSDALLVAATGPGGSVAGYSNSGGGVSIAAPGGDDGAIVVDVGGCNPNGSDCVVSTIPPQPGVCADTTGGCYGLDEGTSMAAPHVAGAAALLIGENPGRSRDDVLHAVESTAHPLAGAGNGLLDVGRALALEPPAAPGGSVTVQAAPRPARVAQSRSAIPATLGAPAPLTAEAPSAPATAAPATTVAATDPGRPARTRHIAAGPTASPAGDPVALPGAVAAALLLAAGVGTGVQSRRRRTS